MTHPRNIFLLTDGSISQPENVVNMIKENNHIARVHTFGIGSGASSYLIEEGAKAGLGLSFMVPDDDPSLNSKVIQALH